MRPLGVDLSGWGALLPLDLGAQVSGHVFARTADPEAIPKVTLDTAALPAGQAVRVSHEGSPDDLAIAYSAALTEIGRRRSRPAGPVIEDYPAPKARGSQSRCVEVTVPMTP